MPRDTILFDINETVLDLASLQPKFEAVFADSGVTATWFAMLLHTSAVCALTKVETGFAALAGVTLDSVAARRGVTISEQQRDDILGGFASLQPHADMVPALQRLRDAGYRTVAFSNSSLSLVTSQITNSGLASLFDLIISVEQTGSFKPDRKVYDYVAARVERQTDELRLVATHDWDTHGAMSAGLMAAYIDRSSAPYNPLYKRPAVFATMMDEVVEQIIREDGR